MHDGLFLLFSHAKLFFGQALQQYQCTTTAIARNSFFFPVARPLKKELFSCLLKTRLQRKQQVHFFYDINSITRRKCFSSLSFKRQKGQKVRPKGRERVFCKISILLVKQQGIYEMQPEHCLEITQNISHFFLNFYLI